MRQTYSKIFDTNWNIVVNLGIKCNTLKISRDAGVRYFSSPFDNMDTVEGLVETSHLISTKFVNYFSDIKMWNIRNEIAPRSSIIRNKIIWHKDTPNVYYPHFADSWFENSITKKELHEWKTTSNLNIEFIWSNFKRIFENRQKRLINHLENKNKILFFRADEPRQLRRVYSTNQNKHLQEFISKIQLAFPKTEVGLMYLYCNNSKYKRNLISSESIYTECIPADVDTASYCTEILKKLKLLPVDDVNEAMLNV